MPTLHLEAAAKAQTPAERLGHLLAAWRALPAREIAALLEATSIACREGQATVDGDTSARKAAWTAVAKKKSATDLERLVEALLVRDDAVCVKRLVALQALAPNPRLLTALLEQLSSTPTHLYGARFWTTVGATLQASGDPRLGDPAIRARLPEPLSTLPLPPSVSSGRRGETEATALDAVTKVVEEDASRRSRVRQEDAAFREAVYAAPHDDAPREVYSDWLLAQGDPRGELIALQIARARRAPAKQALARERALLAGGTAAWLGSEARFIVNDGATFERGFLAAARVERHAMGLSGNVWRTCLELDVSRTRGDCDWVIGLLDTEVFSALERVLGAGLDFFERLLRPQPTDDQRRLDALRRRLRSIGSSGPLDDVARIDGLAAGFPNLEELVWFGSGNPAKLFARVLEGPLREKLRTVRHRHPASSKGNDEHVFILTRGDRWDLRIELGGKDPIGIHVVVSLAVEVVEAIGKHLASLVVRCFSRSQLAPLERAAGRFDLVVGSG